MYDISYLHIDIYARDSKPANCIFQIFTNTVLL